MNTRVAIATPAIGHLLTEQGGHFFGVINVQGELYGLIAAPKKEGEFVGEWIADYKAVDDARSYLDGLVNTAALADAGSELAQKVRALHIGGHDDWYIPARDELELAYRNLKPSSRKNSCSFRDGDNASSVPVGYPYTPDSPAQTVADAFQVDGTEAFEDALYWASTQYAGLSGTAWCQHFGNGGQHYGNKDYEFRARAVRRFKL